MTGPKPPRLPPLSRRGFLAAGAAAPAAQAVGAPTRALPDLAQAWNAERDLLRRLMLRWQELEKDVQRCTGSLDFRTAAKGGDGAALEMIAIDQRLPALFEGEEAAAALIAALPCRSAADALAKLQVGIRIVGPEDTDPTAWTLLRDGYEALLGQSPAVRGASLEGCSGLRAQDRAIATRAGLWLPGQREKGGLRGLQPLRSRAMSLRTIVQTLGGDLYDQGRRANIPAPGHSASDRSVSLLLEDNRIIVHTFGDGDWRAVLDDLRARNLIDAHNAPRSMIAAAEARHPAPPANGRARQSVAKRLWEAGRPLARTASERHCRLRSITRALPGPEALRHGPCVPVAAYRDGGPTRPALLAGIQNADGALTGVEITYLAASGRRAEDLRLSRKTVGTAPAGCAVRLDPAAPEMLVGEGVFTTLSASERFALPAWALMSTRNLRVWAPPEGVRSVLIAADCGKDGEASAAKLHGRLSQAGLAATISLPPAPFGDWNDWSDYQRRQVRRQRRGEEGIGRVRPGAG